MLELNPGFSNGVTLYRESLGADLENIYQAMDMLCPGDLNYAFELSKKIHTLPPSLGRPFEKAIKELLEYIFTDSYDDLEIKEQVPNYGRLRIRDLVITNFNSNSQFLNHLRDRGANHLLFDAKNYKNPLQTADLDTFYNYITENDNFGKLGFILSRKGVSNNLEELLVRRMIKDRVEIVVLDEDDILHLIKLKSSGRDAIAYLEQKLSDLRMKQ